MNAPVDAMRFGSGRAINRIEDPALVAGRGRYTDDVDLPGQLHLVFVRSTPALVTKPCESSDSVEKRAAKA